MWSGSKKEVLTPWEVPKRFFCPVKAGIGWTLVCSLRALVRHLFDYQSSLAFKKRLVEEEDIKIIRSR